MRASNKKFNRPSSPGLNPGDWRVWRCLGGPTLNPKKHKGVSLKLLRCKILPGPSCCQALQKLQCSKSSCHPKLIKKFFCKSSRIEFVRYDVDELDDLGKRSKRVKPDLFQLVEGLEDCDFACQESYVEVKRPDGSVAKAKVMECCHDF